MTMDAALHLLDSSACTLLHNSSSAANRFFESRIQVELRDFYYIRLSNIIEMPLKTYQKNKPEVEKNTGRSARSQLCNRVY
jgi:hypothetical protein